MERFANCEPVIMIDYIESITGPIPHFEVVFETADKKKYKLVFECVWDMRYSIENASLVRFDGFRKYTPDNVRVKDSSIFIVEDSEYIKYFERQVDSTRPVDELTHYIVIDSIDTIIDVLAWRHKPILVPIS